MQQNLRAHNHIVWCNGCGSKLASVKDMVDERCYAILSCMPEMATVPAIMLSSCAVSLYSLDYHFIIPCFLVFYEVLFYCD